MTTPEQLILTFDTVVDMATCDGSALTLHGTATPQPDSSVTFQDANCSYPLPNPTGFSVIVELSPADWMNVQGNIRVAISVATTYISLEANFIQTTSMPRVGSLATTSAVQVLVFAFNMNPPMVNLAALFLDGGFVGIVFSEAVDPQSVVPSGVTINFNNRTTGMPDSLTLSGMENVGLLQDNVGAIIRIGFTPDDYNSLRFYSQEPYSLTIAANSFFDGNSQGNEALSNYMFGIVAPDNSPANLIQFQFDLNVGTLDLTFDEPMQTTNANFSMLRLVSTFDAIGAGYNLNDTVLQSATSLNTVLTLTLTRAVLDAIKSDMALCTNPADCFLSTTGMTINDIQGNPLNSSVDVFAVANYIPDITAPELESYDIDLNTGTMIIDFTEPIDRLDFLPDGITLTDSNRMNPQTLVDSTIASTQASDSVFILTIEESVLSSLKMFQLGGGILLTLTATAASDYAGNQIVPIESSSPLPPTTVQTDITPPMLLGFELSVPQQRQLTLSFSEMVDTSTLMLTSITLTFVSPVLDEMTFTLTGGSVTANGDDVVVTFSNSDFNMISSVYNNSYYGGSFRLTISAGAVSDLNGNMLQALVRPLTFSNVPEYVEGFILDLNFGLVTITFTEPVETDSIVYSNIYLAGELKIVPSGYNLAGGSLDSSNVNMTEVTLLISRDVLNQIKFDPALCTDISNCFLFLVPGSFRDGMGDQLFVAPVRYQVDNITADMTSPGILEYTVDENEGMLSFTFDEPIDPVTFMPSYFTLYDDSFNRSTTLEGAVGSSISMMNTVLTADLGRMILNMVKVVSAGASSLFLTVNESAIMDISGNPVSPIPIMSAINPSRFIIDTNPPMMLDFMALPPSRRSFLMVFDEYVNPATFDSSKLILTLNTRDGNIYSYGPANFSTGTVSTTISDRVTYMFSPTEFDSQFEALYTNAFFEGFIGLTAQLALIEDLDFNRLPAIEDPGFLSNNDSIIPDLSHPTLDSFTFDLNAGRLVMTFSENITLLIVQGQVTFQSSPMTPSTTYILQQEGMSMVDNGVVTLSLGQTDLNNIKNNPNLATSRGNTYLFLAQNVLQDLAGNPLDNSQGAVQATTFIEDSQAPAIVFTTLDLNTGVLSITLTEPVVSTEVNLDQISLAPVSQSIAGMITMEMGTAVVSGSMVSISLPVDTLNQIKSTSGLCSSRDNCFLFIMSTAFVDFNFNSLQAPTNSFLFSIYVPDATPPQLLSFSLNLQIGSVTLHFSESVLRSSLDVSQISLANGAGDSVTLDSATVSEFSSYDAILTLSLPPSSNALNQAKLYSIVGASNVFMYLSSGAISDTSGNAIVTISSSNPLLAFSVVPDMRRPSLVGFSPGEPGMNRMTFRFDEYVNSSTWNGNGLTLTLVTPEGSFPYSNFTEGTLTPDISDVILYNFGGSMLMDPFSTQYMRAYERGSITLSGAMNLIQDIFGNVALDLSVPITFMNVTVESIRPEIQSFTFSAVTGELVMTFNEEVVVQAVPNNVIFENLPNSPQVVISLTRSGTVSSTGNVVTLTLDPADLAAIASNPMIGTITTNTYLRLTPDFASDLNDNQLVGRSAGLQADSVEAQAADTALQSFDLNMDTGELVLSFNNIIDVSTVQGTMLTIQNSQTSNTVSVSLSVLSAPNSLIDSATVTISIHMSDLNIIKSIVNLASDSSSSFLSFPSTFAQDVLGNAAVGISSTDALQVNTFTSDGQAPIVTRFSLDMNSGLINLAFDEPVDLSSVQFTSLTIQNAVSQSVSYTLTGGQITSPSSNARVSVDITMTMADLNAIKSLSNLATATTDSFLGLGMGAVSDTAQNMIATQAVQANQYQRDISAPNLLYFDLDLTDEVNAIITLLFDEPIELNAPTTLPGITLQNAANTAANTTLTLSTADTLEQNTTFDLMITLRPVYSTQLLSGRGIATSVNNLYITVTMDSIVDFSNNPLPAISTAAAMRVRYICELIV